MEARNLSLTLEASSQPTSHPRGRQPRNVNTLETLEQLNAFRAEWGRHRGQLLIEGRAHLDRLDIPTRRRNNLHALYQVLMTFPLEDIRFNRHYGFCLYPGGYARLKQAGIRGCRGPVRQRFDDLVEAKLIEKPVRDDPKDKYSQLVIPLAVTPLCKFRHFKPSELKLERPPVRRRKKVEKPIHYKNKKTVYRLSNFSGHATLAVLQAQPGLKAAEIAEIRGVKTQVVWADLRAAKSLELVEKVKTRYFPKKAAANLREDQLREMDTCETARMEALTALFKSEDFYIKTLQKIDLPDKIRSNRKRAAQVARAKINRIHDGEPLSVIYGLRGN